MFDKLCESIAMDKVKAATYKVLYEELIYAVGSKWPGESRHETALRYIKEAEERYEPVPAKQDIKINNTPHISISNSGLPVMSWNVRDIIFGPNRGKHDRSK